MRRVERFLAAATILAIAGLRGGDARACGLDIPDQVLRGEAMLLSLPAMDYAKEVALIPAADLPETRFPRVSGVTAAEAEAEELAAALRARGDSPERVRSILAALAAHRRVLDAVPEQRWRREHSRPADSEPLPPLTVPEPPAGLPEAFALYLRGAAAWHLGDVKAAREAWQAVLALPPAARRGCEVRAHFMLGRSVVDSAHDEALAHFHEVRGLVARGAPDPQGLALAAAGWTARAEYRSRHYARGLTIYHALGDVPSQWMVLRNAFQDERAIEALARDPLTRRLGTVYVVAQGGPPYAAGFDPDDRRVAAWLAVVERVSAGSVVDADRLAWIAYSAGDFDGAARWLARSAVRTPAAMWVEAKLLYRAGRFEEASGRLAEAARAFPTDETWPDARDGGEPYVGVLPSRRLLAEHGALELRRGDFVSSLDALLASGRWLDAAYVAERVLTVDELSAFVRDRMPRPEGEPDASAGSVEDIPSAAVHDLLARRLARAGRWAEAMPHFPPELRAKAESLVANLAAGRDGARPVAARAASLTAAARTLRREGIDLVGTETGPDWAVFDGDFDFGGDDPAKPPRAGPLAPGEAERAAAALPTPLKRWHYRYLALDVAWEAAGLMPDGDDATAAWLAEAGRWVAGRDPKAADRFYKALVRRCGATPLGQAAAKAKWFPKEPRPGDDG